MAVLMAMFWVVYVVMLNILYFKIIDNPGVVDLAWEACHTLPGIIVYIKYSDYYYIRPSIFLIILLFWLIRLGGFVLITRIIPREMFLIILIIFRDPRQDKIVAKFKYPKLFYFI